jgi:hypothetical protein
MGAAGVMTKGAMENSMTSFPTFDFKKLFNDLKREHLDTGRLVVRS